MNSKLERIKTKIEKLIALASSTSNKHESENAMKKVAVMMQKYHIESGDLNTAEFVKERVRHRRKSLASSEVTLANLVSKAFGVFLLYRNYRSEHSTLIFVGSASDVEVARYVFDVALTNIDNLTNKFKAKKLGRSANVDYKAGLCSGLGWRLVDMNEKAEQELASTGTDLMCVDDRKAKAEDWYKNEHGKPRSRQLKKRDLGQSYYQGLEDSESININKGITSDVTETLALGVS